MTGRNSGGAEGMNMSMRPETFAQRCGLWPLLDDCPQGISVQKGFAQSLTTPLPCLLV